MEPDPQFIAMVEAELGRAREYVKHLEGLLRVAGVSTDVRATNAHRTGDESGPLLRGGSPNGKTDSPDGLRASILAVLRSAAPTGLSPSQIVKALTARGFKPGGKTQLSVQVANEVYRLHKRGRLDRGEDHTYIISPLSPAEG